MPRLSELRKKNLELAREAVKKAITQDALIINTISSIDELRRATITLTRRLREWYSAYLPELDKKIPDNQAFVSLIINKSKKALMSELKIKESLGSELEQKDLEPIISMAKTINDLTTQTNILEKYLEHTMQACCPNLSTLAGINLGARLLREAGSLKKLAMMRSSTIQLLGAEKALFRHLQTGAKPPKHGYIIQHPFIQKTGKIDKGKASRILADKISIAARVDYFKGEFIGDELLKELEVRLK